MPIVNPFIPPAIFQPAGTPDGTKFLRDDQVWSNPAGGPGGNPTIATAEVSLGSAPDAFHSGKFQITGLSGLTVDKAVSIQQANGPYTGKGTLADEAEMDQVLVTGKVLSDTTIQCYWSSRNRVRGNFKFNYWVSA